MTRRERLENKLEKRREWAAKRSAKASAKIAQAIEMTSCIPMGQPILIGHHSEKGHRALLTRSDAAMRSGVESHDMAKHHESKAEGLEAQLDSSIYSDDPDALEQLAKRIAELEAERANMKAANVYWRKHRSMKGFPGLTDEQAAKLDADIPTRYSWARQPFAPYSLQNLGGNIARLKKRIQHVKSRQQRTELAEAATGGVLIEGGEYVRVTFADKPDRSVLNDLKAAGFHWGAGSWCGRRDKIPTSVNDLLEPDCNTCGGSGCPECGMEDENAP